MNCTTPPLRTDLLLLVPLLLFGLIGGVPSLSAQESNQLERAQSLETQQDFGRALKLFREYQRDHPTSVAASRGWLRTAIRAEQWDQGRRALRRLEKIDGTSPTTAELGTQLFFRQQAYDTALTWGERYRDRANDSWKPFHFLSQIHLKQGQVLTAVRTVESAQLRSENNPWVLLDELLVEYNRRQLSEAINTARQLREVSSDPTIYWKLARTLSDQFTTEELAELFTEGSVNLPPADPPILAPVEEDDYRYWWSRLSYRSGDTQAARSALRDPPATFRSQWLQARLIERTERRKQAQQNVLDQWPDRVIAQWQQSRLVKKSEPLGSTRRRRGARFFYREFENNRFLDYSEGALSALLRSIELHPLDEERQFALSKFYRDRGWQKKERMAALRARTLGFDPPSRVSDYIEGLGEPDTDSDYDVPQPTVGVHIKRGSPWVGPLDGVNELTSVFRQNLYHQPGLISYQRTIASEDELSSLVQGDTLDAGINVTVRTWTDEMTATVDLMMSSNRIVSSEFYDNDDMKEWRLLNRTIQSFKEQWSWVGTIHEVTDNGAWVNLGRIHGVTTDDTFEFVTPQPEFPDELPVGEVREDRLRLDFPSPYFRTIIPRGDKARIKRE